MGFKIEFDFILGFYFQKEINLDKIFTSFLFMVYCIGRNVRKEKGFSMKKLSTQKLVYMALFAALVYIFSRFFQIPIVTPLGQTRFHLGNVFCLLGGLLLGPVYGGISAGVGSALFDLFDPVYFTSAPITFITKFAMAFVAGIIYKKRDKVVNTPKLVLASALGQITYVILYLAKTFIKNRMVLGLTMEATMAEVIQKGSVSMVNAVISVIVATILAIPLLKAVKFED